MTAASKKIPNLLGRAALNRDDIFQVMTYVLSKFAATIVGCGSRRMVQADGAEKYCGINTIAWTVHGRGRLNLHCDLGWGELT